MTIIQKALIYLLTALLAISVGYGIYAHIDLKVLRSDNKALNDDIKTYKKQVADANNQIKDQNTKILDAQTKSKNLQSKLDSLNDVLLQNARKYKKIIDDLKKQPAPKDCAATVIYLKNSLDGFK